VSKTVYVICLTDALNYSSSCRNRQAHRTDVVVHWYRRLWQLLVSITVRVWSV